MKERIEGKERSEERGENCAKLRTQQWQPRNQQGIILFALSPFASRDDTRISIVRGSAETELKRRVIFTNRFHSGRK